MSEDKKEVEETTEENSNEEETLETNDNSSESEEDASKETTETVEETTEEEEEIDYTSLYEEEKARREKAEHKIVKMKAKKLDEDDEEEEEEEDIKSYIDKKLGEMKVLTLEEKYNEAINKVSSNESEKKLIRLYLEDNNFSGDVTEQVQKAKALANYKKVAEANKELAKAQATKAGGEDSSSYKPSKKKEVSNLTDRDIAFLKKRGIYDKYVEKYGK